MAVVLLRRNVRLDCFLDELVSASLASYNDVRASRAEPEASPEVEQNLRKRFREILRADMVVGEDCGLSIICAESALAEPWSEEAERALRGDEEAEE